MNVVFGALPLLVLCIVVVRGFPNSDIVSPTITCPPEYAEFNGHCVKSTVENSGPVDEIITCSFGYTLSSSRDSCLKSETTSDTVLPEYQCPSGYIKQGHSCVSLEPTHCPAGFQYNGRECVKVEAVCPSGYSFHSNMCWPIEGPKTAAMTMPIQPISPPNLCGGFPCPMPVVQQPCGVHPQCPYTSTPCTKFPCTPLPPPPPPITVVQPPCGHPPCPYTSAPCPSYPCPPPTPQPPIPPIPPITVHPTPPTVPPFPVCPPGYRFDGEICVIIWTDIIPPIRKCPPGYFYKYGRCEKETTTIVTMGKQECPPGYILIGRWCTHSTKEKIAITEEVPNNWAIHINNPVNVTTNINNENNHTINIFGGKECCNNTRETEKITTIEQKEKCCEVVSPRMCHRRMNRSWQCSHKIIDQCGSGCTAPRITLRPPNPVYHPNRIIMMPQPMIYRPNPMFQSHGK